jgi:uncharacterized protein
MSQSEDFRRIVTESYSFKGESLLIGSAILDKVYDLNCQVRIPLKTLNRHGLICGATGTGKTKTLQVLAEGLSEAGVASLLMDIKGDVSGLARPGTLNEVIEKRTALIGSNWAPTAFPVELMSISDESGVKLRATLSEFGPLLLGNILGLNENQQSVLSLIFDYCDDRNLPLLDSKDLQTVLRHIQDEGKDDFSKNYGLVQSSTAGLILRKLLEVDQQGGDKFFGETSFEVNDLIRKDKDGRGFINILRLTDIQTRPSLFSAFMLCLLAEIFQKFPERGDVPKPELVIFIDEAHLIFNNASKELIDQLEMTVKLIRSKGVGIILITQVPADIPENILAQLGLKVQHALRAFTAKDRKSIKEAAENYPESTFYKVEDLMTQLGIGEAFVTGLNESGMPTELVHTLIIPPKSRMDILTGTEIDNLLSASELAKEYNQEIDRESAFELLTHRINSPVKQPAPANETTRQREETQKGTFEEIMKSPVTKVVVREVTRGLLGVLGVKTTRSRRSGGIFF